MGPVYGPEALDSCYPREAPRGRQKSCKDRVRAGGGW